MLPNLAVRSAQGLSLITWNGDDHQSSTPQTVSDRQCSCFCFDRSGRKFAWCDKNQVSIMETKNRNILTTLNLPKTHAMYFSPDGQTLCTWEVFLIDKDNKPLSNLNVWDSITGERLHSFVQKKYEYWHPEWFKGNDNICAKVFGGSVNFCSDNNYATIASKLHIEKLESFSLSPNSKPPYRVACFVRGTKGSPSSVRMFEYPKFSSDEILAHKSFFKADSVNMIWNNKGTSILIKTAVDIDTTGSSYYGEQALYYMSCDGETSSVGLSKNGPIYDVAWSKDSNTFCVIYGFMPSKASLFNLKCNEVFQFGKTPKNECHYNPHGNLLALAGFGNLRGTLEIWDSVRRKQVAQHTAPDTTYFEWCSDGVHFVTATTAPRLRVNNGYSLWHYSKGLLFQLKAPGDLYQVAWQPVPDGSYAVPVIEEVSQSKIKSLINAAKPTSYVPPHARGNPNYSPKFKDDEEENESSPLSKSAAKNKKKRDGKKSKGPVANKPTLSAEQNDVLSMAKYLLAPEAKPQANTGSQLSDKEKTMKGLRKKLQAIEKLKAQKNAGKTLEKNQLEKLESEQKLIDELNKLQAS